MTAEAAVVSAMDPIMRAIVTISVLIFFAKVLASVFSNMKLPEVLGELLAGVIFGPYALGAGIIIFGEPLVVLNEYVDAFAEIGAIMIRFFRVIFPIEPGSNKVWNIFPCPLSFKHTSRHGLAAGHSAHARPARPAMPGKR